MDSLCDFCTLLSTLSDPIILSSNVGLNYSLYTHRAYSLYCPEVLSQYTAFWSRNLVSLAQKSFPLEIPLSTLPSSSLAVVELVILLDSFWPFKWFSYWLC